MTKQFKKRIALVIVLILVVFLGTGGWFLWNQYQNRHVFTVYQEGNYISQAVIDEFTKETGVKVELITGDRTPQAFENTVFADTSSLTVEEQVEDALMGQEDGSSDPADENKDPLFGLDVVDTLQYTHDQSIAKAKAKAEKKKVEVDYDAIKYDPAVYDVVLTKGEMLGELVERNLLANLSQIEMENRNTVSGDFCAMPYDPDGAFTVTTIWEYMGLLVNVELAEGQLTSWDALWDDTYANQVIMPSDAMDSAAAALLTIGRSVGDPDADALNAAFDKLEEQKALVSTYHSRDAFLLMENQMGALYPCWSGDALEMMSENPSLIFMVPQGGTCRTTLGYGIAAESKFPEEAAAFLDYMCRPDAQAKNAVYSRHASTSEAAIALMDDNWSKNPVLYPDKSITDGTPILTTLPKELREILDARWEKLVQ